MPNPFIIPKIDRVRMGARLWAVPRDIRVTLSFYVRVLGGAR